ncbi:MAG TPA: S-methyl-5'-thioadenosine phosphorylase [Planctomycetota bacterium]|nr:S-methyl-5'-thioadenosine phosphorylase [Planctomycetota bacterium]
MSDGRAVKVGVIGGSGLYEIEGIAKLREVRVATPFGKPSDAFITGELAGVPCAFLPRHGRGHRFLPTEIPFRANLWAMKSLGVTHVISLSAVGSLREEIVPGHFVVVDQFFDRTRQRASTFFGGGIVGHVVFADPVCNALGATLVGAAKQVGVTVHAGGTYVCMEGPAFSTRAESHFYRSIGGAVIGMTNLQEAKLAREAEIHYATIAMSTDYDCWHPHHEDVTVETVMKVMAANVGNAKALVKAAIPKVAAAKCDSCDRALASAVMTQRSVIPPAAVKKLAPMLGKYFPELSKAKKASAAKAKSARRR